MTNFKANLVVIFLLWPMVLGGCSSVVTLSVPRPALIDVRDYGGAVTIQSFEGEPEAAEEITQGLRYYISKFGGRTVRHDRRNAEIIIYGRVGDYSFYEDVEYVVGTCQRTIRAGVLFLNQTNEYVCFHDRRVIKGQVDVDVIVIDRLKRNVIFEKTFKVQGRFITQLSREYLPPSPKVRSVLPSILEAKRVLPRLHMEAAKQLSRVILPWREEVTVVLGRCGPARTQCQAGVAALEREEYRKAVRSFKRAIKVLQSEDITLQAKYLASAYWNLGLSHEYDRNFEEATRAIETALKLDPTQGMYALELRNIRRFQVE